MEISPCINIVDVPPQLPQPTPFQEVGVVYRDLEEEEVKKIERFVREGCGCSSECSKKFDVTYIQKNRNDLAELTHDEMDFILMGAVLCCASDSTETTVVHHKSHQRSRQSMMFLHKGSKV